MYHLSLTVKVFWRILNYQRDRFHDQGTVVVRCPLGVYELFLDQNNSSLEGSVPFRKSKSHLLSSKIDLSSHQACAQFWECNPAARRVWGAVWKLWETLCPNTVLGTAQLLAS